MSVLLDVLAENTYYTAFNANMVVNELFLDSVTLRDNVIALAKQLGIDPVKGRSRGTCDLTATYTVAAPKVSVLQNRFHNRIQ